MRSQPTTMSFSVQQRGERTGVQRGEARYAVLPAPQSRARRVSWACCAICCASTARRRRCSTARARPDARRVSRRARLRRGLSRRAPGADGVARCGRRPRPQILEFPARYLVRFMANHQMLQLAAVRRGAWYAAARRATSGLARALAVAGALELSGACGASPPIGTRALEVPAGTERFDQVVLACHSDQALALLSGCERAERAILGAIPYQDNERCCTPTPRCCR